MTVKVKWCGFTRPEDVRAAVALGVDALGFNFACGPRRIAVDQGAALAALLPPFVTATALFVDATEDEILRTVTKTRCTAIQLHGNEPPELAAALARRLPVLKAFPVRTAGDIDRVVGYPADAYLLDAAVPGHHGGTGVAWDHHLLVGRDLGRPVVLAGGLTPDTVAAAVAAVHPWGVDSASGIEMSPGLKDVARMRGFLAALGR
jgi:phosphoribosylanthranilate isomerase